VDKQKIDFYNVGEGGNVSGKNMLGQLLMKLRGSLIDG
tara:strand:+ start:175 stop:288 length:114 start_codon:yes stop_codon:yes gene_type:complete